MKLRTTFLFFAAVLPLVATGSVKAGIVRIAFPNLDQNVMAGYSADNNGDAEVSAAPPTFGSPAYTIEGQLSDVKDPLLAFVQSIVGGQFRNPN
jgi:hypothetical protein